MKISKDPEWRRLVGHRIAVLRQARGVSQADLARSLRISAQRLSNYERGSRPLDVATAIDLAEKLDGTLDYIYTGNMRSLTYEQNQRVAEVEGRLAYHVGEEHALKN